VAKHRSEERKSQQNKRHKKERLKQQRPENFNNPATEFGSEFAGINQDLSKIQQQENTYLQE
jgi:hypothetical protein